jgi:hypothetical protein
LAGWFAVLALTGVAIDGCSAKTIDNQTYDAPWRLVQSAPTDSSVVLEYFHGDCDSLSGVSVTTGEQSVRIAVRLTSTVPTCDAAERRDFLRVRLGSPLGNRHIDGECSTPRGCVEDPVETPAANASIPVYGPTR